MRSSRRLSRLLAATVVVSAGHAVAAPTVNGNIISWPDDGWYQVQNADTYESLCQGGRSCDVPAGVYHIINLTTGERFERVQITTPDGENPGGGDGVYPSFINLDTASAPLLEPLLWSFNGEPVTGSYVADADGDGIRDFVFMTSNADAAPCETQVVVLSSLNSSTALTTSDLPDTLQLSSTLFAEKDFDGNGCFNIDSISNARDINGDGLEDLSLFMDAGYLPPYYETFYQSSAVVFGSRTGALRDVASLDGQNGFLITDTQTPIDGVGDVNGDGYGDYSFQNSGFFKLSEVHLMAGTPTLPARRMASEILDEPSIALFAGGTRLFSLGDVNADGLADFYSRTYPFGARIHLGSLTGSIVSQASSYMTVQSVGDHDNDGHDDFLVSTQTSGCGFNGQISAIIYGSSDNDYLTSRLSIEDFGTPGQTRLLSRSSNTCGLLGAQSLGDLNGDGADDALVGSHVLLGTPGRQEVLVSAEDLDGTNGFELNSNSYDLVVDGVDVDADGYSDIVINGSSTVRGMPTVPFDSNGPQQIVVQARQAAWTIHWQSPGAQAVTFSLSLNGTELGMTSQSTTISVTGSTLDQGGILVVSALDEAGNELGRNTRQIPAYEEYAELSANVYGPKAIELPFNGESRSVNNLYHLVWRNGELIDRTSPSGVRSYFDSGAQPGQIYRYYIQPDYLLREQFEVSNLNRWPQFQRASRIAEAWTPLEGVAVPPAGSGVKITDGNTLYWPDDGNYVVRDAVDNRILCEGGLACVVPNGTYTVSNLSAGVSYTGIVVSGPEGGGTPDGIAPTIPRNVTIDFYSARVAELFWDRPAASERVVRTEIFRDGEYLGSTRGTSYYDGARLTEVAHWYELVAIDADGDRSLAGTLNARRAIQTLLPEDPATSRSYQFETALDGDTAVIGSAGFDNSSITVQQRDSASGNWTITQQIDKPVIGSYSEIFGSHIALSGDTMAVIGRDTTNEDSWSTVLYIFTRNEEGLWEETQQISNPINDSDSVSVNGNTMAVRRDAGVEIFIRDEASGQWASNQLISIGSDDYYPDRGLVIEGDYLALGRVGHLSEGVESGAVYLYRRSESGLFLLDQQLVPDSISDIRFAGRSIAFDGESVAVSANQGRVLVFERDSAGNWLQTADIASMGPDYVIPTLAIDGDRLLIGTTEAAGLVDYSGSVTVFEKQSSNEWTQLTRLVPSTGASYFGSSVNLEGNTALVGAGTSAIDNGTEYASVAVGHVFDLD